MSLAADPKAIAFEVARMDLHPGDTLVVKSPQYLTTTQRKAFNTTLGNLALNGAKVLLLDPGWDIEVVRAQQRALGQRGNATLQAIAGTLGLAFILGVFGPTLDSRAYNDYGAAAASDTEGEAARLDAEARRYCGAAPKDNSGWIQLQDGVIVCTDKRGRRQARSVITIPAHQIAQGQP